ncbi:hypothetical protein SerAS12_4075 [Serratia sp. AS12]|nr:hypothetical protein SerAS9_4074 [Serratia plymuthica AS9]AEF52125.1 hypothetical protein SerAS12_4075 [Serratia sp. AS12]AEG29832.1 hypothetical protein SerAS13_4075 [Serratia sp. AS13]
MVTANLFHYYKLHRYDGQLLYLKVASFGAFCVIGAAISAAIIKFFFPDFHLITDVASGFQVTKNKSTDRIYAWMAMLSIGSIAISLLWVLIVFIKNLFLGFMYEKQCHYSIPHAMKLRVLRMTVNHGTFDAMLLDAMEETPKRPVLISLSSRKVYIGIVNGLDEPTENEKPNQYISLFPIMSGYRDSSTLSIEFTNNYPSEFKTKSALSTRTMKKKQINDMDLIISSEEISSISWFDFPLFMETNGSAIQKPEKSIGPGIKRYKRQASRGA